METSGEQEKLVTELVCVVRTLGSQTRELLERAGHGVQSPQHNHVVGCTHSCMFGSLSACHGYFLIIN